MQVPWAMGQKPAIHRGKTRAWDNRERHFALRCPKAQLLNQGSTLPCCLMVIGLP